ncbi:MAG: DUF1571 domain-containing protein [Rubinisphaera brasiliensis]|uniref:DUF1571 domain-containing protein n=1 Tax=Rubinisphaera brasiliensis (strain ATCC 49424 / DSM 5305 / JCM 21570 / IAM 15109 / NBRC 103401 / IFAM 1448) TaxID=756272 RepID=F0SLM3_RUBBR|nr:MULTISPECIES: DUF1571 domain-containing protein [Rubinisphaera]ADY57706.1 protein of unknown function DUF1571 [Rubinisphaera brasiliensis DSM 5305]MBR9800594.1 DUF1571 domain-containing protein [bacterium]
MISIHRTILATLKIRTALLVAMTAGCLLSVSNAQARDIPENHPYVPVLKVAGVAQKAIREVNDYQGVLTKREYIGKKLHTQQMEIKVRHEPFSVYLKFREPFAGREVLFVEGQNNNQMLAHEGSGLASIVGTISLPLDSSRAMENNKYPVNMIGMSNMIDKVVERWEYETQFGECEVKYYPNAQLGNVQCRVVETSHPQPRRQFRFSLTRLYLDKETNLPIRCECYGFPMSPNEKPPLLEEYTYTSLRVNVGLRDFDFDRNNPSYQF